MSRIDATKIAVMKNKKKNVKNGIYKVNKNIRWIIPIVKSKRKIYDIEDLLANDSIDIDPKETGNVLQEEFTLINMFKKNNIPDEENKYKFLLRNLNKLYVPRKNYEMDIDRQIYLTKNVKHNIKVLNLI